LRSSHRRSAVWARLVCIAVLASPGCTSPPLGTTARKGNSADEQTPVRGSWFDDETVKSAGAPRYHKAKPGESFADIAALYGMTVPELLRSNHGLDPADGLKPGQLIYVPRQ